ncbi:antibiotic biosynthesis monooxygenase family protein [Mesorhizobium sp. M0074]|uniref:antibiotic biosynthesis monooxygenase family protein n=1 Tax=Mesorhizobium sp. M0074 TaxID=2956869 RepID=UPI00333760A7
MIAVISEVWPHPDRCSDYDTFAKELRPLLEAIDGFISAERFERCSEPGKFLSFSLWRDEAALSRWRTLAEHRV